jgi:hypothetical protein
MAAEIMFKSFYEECSDEAIARVWNKILVGTAKKVVLCSLENARTTLKKGDVRTRGALKHFLGDRWKNFNLIDGGCIEAKAPPIVSPTYPTPACDPSTSKGTTEKQKLSPMEQQLMFAAAQQGTFTTEAIETIRSTLEPDVIEDLMKAVEETKKTDDALAHFVVSMCRKADQHLENFCQLVGEPLWKNTITIEQDENSSLRIILVHSSTAPLFGTKTIVKHDFRADGKPVNVHHEAMFRQLDGQRLIRSKVFIKGAHEYYVKGLQYRDGMRFKGYFEVNGLDQSHLTRYSQVQGNRVVQITEAQYRDLENQAAGKLPEKK